MTIELTLDNGVHYLLKVPKCLFNSNTKQFFIDTFVRWVSNEIDKESE